MRRAQRNVPLDWATVFLVRRGKGPKRPPCAELRTTFAREGWRAQRGVSLRRGRKDRRPSRADKREPRSVGRTCAPARIVTRDAVVRHCAPEILSTEFDIASRFYSGGSRHALRGFHSLAKVTHLNGDTSPKPLLLCASKKHRARLRSASLRLFPEGRNAGTGAPRPTIPRP